jgi:hypothetical protein
MGNAVYTGKRQFRAFFESDRWTPGNERRRQWGVIAMSYPLAFNGPSVNDDRFGEGRAENDVVEAWITRSRKRGANVWWSLGARVIANFSEGGWGAFDLTCDTIPVPPECALLDAAPSVPFRHSTVMLTAGRAFDTRDVLFAPTRGRFTELTVSGAYETTRQEPFLRIRLDSRGFRPAAGGTLAIQGLVHGVEGNAPVDQIVVMGSGTFLRGYEQGLLRDAWMAGGQLEWRRPTPLLRNHVAIAIFGGGAVMASRVGDLPGGEFFPSVGGGLRFRLGAGGGSSVRVDYGVGRAGNSGLYVAFNEAF